jgi:tetratricopeptide (TPR) repeat protein
MATHIGVPEVRTSGQYLRKTLILKLAVVILLAFAASCTGKAVRVKVSNEDLIRSNEASQEADIAFNRKDFYTALIKYLEAVRLNPNNEFLYNRMGITYSQLRYYSEAVEAFKRSIQLNSKYAYAVNNLGSVYFAQKQLKKAEKCFKKAIGMKVDEASFYMNLGSLYFERKKTVQAMALWRKGMAMDPNTLSKNAAVNLATSSPSKERNYLIARIYASAGDTAKAIEHLKQAITDGFTDIDAIATQPDFDPIRKDEQFVEFMKNASVLVRLRSETGGLNEKPPLK